MVPSHVAIALGKAYLNVLYEGPGCLATPCNGSRLRQQRKGASCPRKRVLTPCDAIGYVQRKAEVLLFCQGGECFGYFMQWGLPKATLKDIWELVAGDEGRLTQRHFVSCIYLMELAKTGNPLPQRLPPGPFPPVLQPAAPAAWERSVSLSDLQGVRSCISLSLMYQFASSAAPRNLYFRTTWPSLKLWLS